MQLLTIKGGWSMNRRFDIRNGTVRILKDGRHHECTLTVKNGQVTEAEDIEYPPDAPGDRIVTTKEKSKTERIKAAAIRTVSRYLHKGKGFAYTGMRPLRSEQNYQMIKAPLDKASKGSNIHWSFKPHLSGQTNGFSESN